jgi:hypothetical protein
MQTSTILEHYMSLKLFDTQLGTQGMEDNGELWHCLVPFLPECGPSCIYFVITSNRVVLFLKIIHEGNPSGCKYKQCISLCFIFLSKSLPPIFDMGDDFEEHKCNLFSIKKFVDKKIPL